MSLIATAKQNGHEPKEVSRRAHSSARLAKLSKVYDALIVAREVAIAQRGALAVEG